MELTAARWRRVNEVFAEAMQQPPGLREDWVAAAIDDDPPLAAYVQSLLRVDPSVEITVEGVFDRPGEGEQSRGLTMSGSRIGPFEIDRLLGEGGMGRVYLAHRADEHFEQQVAIKVGAQRLVDPMTQARLRAERQILANLAHPNIAKLFDGGTTSDGVPYLVMEYVDGVPIDVYCDSHRLTVAERLELLVTVCDAIHYAHQNLVIHRDIKAANVLVTDDGVPKLLDFGIAKLIDHDGHVDDGLTREGVAVLTPSNAAPEQIRQQPITTATDTYALGLLMYRLLSGTPAFDLTNCPPMEFARIVCDHPPTPPSQLFAQIARSDAVLGQEIAADRRSQPKAFERLLRGDIDTIVMKALRKEPHRRYGSCLELADDIHRHLHALPIEARADSQLYKARKFVQRHALGVASAAAALVTLLVFAIVLSVQNERITAERDHAIAVSRFLEEIFTTPDPAHARGLDKTAKEILAVGAERIRNDLGDRPEVQSELMETIGRVYLNLGEYTPSIEMLEASLALRLESLGAEHADVARGKNQLAEALIRKAEYARARDLLEQSLAVNRARRGAASPEVADNLYNLAELHLATGGLDAAESYANQSIGIYVPLGIAYGIELAEAKNTLSRILQVRGRLDETERLLRESIEIVEATGGKDHPLLAYYLQNLGVLLQSQGKLVAAEETLEEAIETTRRVLGEKHDLVATTLSIQGGLLQQRGAYDEAEAAYREALAIDIERRGPAHPYVGYDLTGLAILLHDMGRLPEAEERLREALGIYAASLDPDHQYIASALTELGAVLVSRDAASDAVPLLTEALRIRRVDYPDDNVLTAATMVELGSAVLDTGQTDEARALILNAAEILRGRNDRRAKRALAAMAQLENAPTGP